ncbi:MAG: DNA methyltransferase [Campylobacterota bacterium]|nr:DNA methyltransferase [Campylobacterota bacterium]
MNILQLELKLQDIVENLNKDDFIFDFLLAYELSKANISRLKNNNDLNTLDINGELIVKNKKIFFKIVEDMDSFDIDTLLHTQKKMRYIIVTDFKTLKAKDTKHNIYLDIPLIELPKNSDFFWDIAGVEKAAVYDEKEADVKASIKMAKLYEEIIKTNEISTQEEIHSLNVFLTRLLFCYFAEDTDIFKIENLFTNYLKTTTNIDGSDVDTHISTIFDTLNSNATDKPNHLKDFPYVNGGLFKDKLPIPKFNSKSRRLLLECGGELNWSQINPDIFGSMIQAVISDEHRGGNGMHYTSVPNIMKVINPLFLDDLKEEFEKSKGNDKKLNALHKRITNLKVFDPACGSGNFLIIAYKELRKLEMDIFKSAGMLNMPSIKLSQFYGIELDDFAHEVAILSLWLTEHQMNIEFIKEFGNCTPTLPLQDGGNIVCGNATRLEWDKVCPKNDGDEIYVLGNPPYLGYYLQSKNQKEDIKDVFSIFTKRYKELDYIACWFYNGAKYIKGINSKCAFVSANSINQGEQVSMLWPYIFEKDIEINFAYKSFKWSNNAKANAGVIVSVIGLSNKLNQTKYLYQEELKKEVKTINAYLLNSVEIIIQSRTKPLSSSLNQMILGSMANDDGNFFLTLEEKEMLLSDYPESYKFIKKTLGSAEFIRGIEKWCLWIEDDDLDEALKIPMIKNRLENITLFRSKSSAKCTVEYAKFPNKWKQRTYKDSNSVIVPIVSSERREYIPTDFLSEPVVIKNSAYAIYDATLITFAIISSKIHMVWMKTFAGRLKSDYRYSSSLVYNTFPFPKITQTQKDKIEELVHLILDERDKNYTKTMAELYDPDKMPEGLKLAHHNLDIYIESCYRDKAFESDEERLEYLFRLYEKMIREEK